MVFLGKGAVIFILIIVLAIIFLPIFWVIYAVCRRKKRLLKSGIVFLFVIYGSIYILYCRHLEPKKVTHYCIDRQCISIIHQYKGGGVNAVTYARIYKGKIFFRFQAQTNNYAELLMEDDIHISKKPVENKFIIYGSLPKMHGKVDNIEIRKASGYIDRGIDNCIVSRDLKFRRLY